MFNSSSIIRNLLYLLDLDIGPLAQSSRVQAIMAADKKAGKVKKAGKSKAVAAEVVVKKASVKEKVRSRWPPSGQIGCTSTHPSYSQSAL